MTPNLASKSWFVYLVRASDDSLYTGITNDLERRISTHNQGKGSKSLLGKLPVTLVYTEKCATRSAALKREHEIKTLKRSAKEALIAGNATP